MPIGKDICSESFPKLKEAILGSGTPNPDPNRNGSSYAVITNGTAYLVDFGPGVVRNASALSPTCRGRLERQNQK